MENPVAESKMEFDRWTRLFSDTELEKCLKLSNQTQDSYSVWEEGEPRVKLPSRGCPKMMAKSSKINGSQSFLGS